MKKRLLALCLVVCLVLSMLPMTALAAEQTVTFEFGENVAAGTHSDGGTTSVTEYSETVGGYTLNLVNADKLYTASACDAQGNSCIKMGSSSVAGTFTFTVPEEVQKVIIKVAGYKAKTTKVSVNGGDEIQLTTSSDNGEYTDIEVDTTTNKTVTFATVTGATRAMVNSITYVLGEGATPPVSSETPSEEPSETPSEEPSEEPAGDGAVFQFGENGAAAHVDGNAYDAYTETANGYTLTLENLVKVYGPAYDALGNSCIKLGTSSAIGSFSFTVPEDIIEVQIEAAMYKAKSTKVTVNGTETTLTGSSNDGAYTVLTVDTSVNKTVSFATVSGNCRTMINSITWVAGEVVEIDHINDCDDYIEIAAADPTCEGKGYTAGKFCNTCGVYFDGASEIPALGHAYGAFTDNGEGAWVATCANDAAHQQIAEILTVEEAIDLGASQTNKAFTAEKYCVTGVVTTIVKEDYGNLYIKDEAGNELYIYGTYSADGTVRYDKMDPQPKSGDTITLIGVLGNYNGAQMKDGWMVAYEESPCEHIWADATCTEPKTCTLCGATDGAALGHTTTITIDGTNVIFSCTACEDYSETITALTLTEAIAKANEGGSNYTTDKYYIAATVKEVYNTSYGNMYLTDGVVESFTVYGTYGEDGTYFNKLAAQPVAGDTVVLYGPLGTFNSTPQMKNATLIAFSHVECEHVWADATCEAPKTCTLCGATEGELGDHTYTDNICSVCGMEDPTAFDYSGNYYIAALRNGTYQYMTSDLGTASNLRYQIVDSGLAELPASIAMADAVANQIFTLTKQDDGTYLISAYGVETDNYLGHTATYNNGTLVAADAAVKATVTRKDGVYNIFYSLEETKDGVTSTVTRYLSLNSDFETVNTDGVTVGYNYYAWYKGTQIQDLALIPVVEETVCGHESTSETIVEATCVADGSITETCDECGETIATEVLPATGEHTYAPVSAANAAATCSVCGKEVFAWAGMAVSLESSLQATFVVQTSKLPAEGYYAVVEKEVFDKTSGEISVETTRFEAADFVNYNTAGTMKKIVFSGVAAKQMTDRFTVTIYNADDEQISASYTRTIEEYILSLFSNAKTSEAMKVVAVDFLNYGAAAQDKFGYRTTELANRGLTDELKALATADSAVADVTDDRTKGALLAGTAVAAEFEIIPSTVYQTSKITNVVKAEVSYVNFKGETVSYEVAAADFANYNTAGTMKKIEIKGTAVADGASPITVKLIDADGNVVDETVECVNYYCARMAADHEVFNKLLKVIYSAKVAFA